MVNNQLKFLFYQMILKNEFFKRRKKKENLRYFVLSALIFRNIFLIESQL